MKMSSTDKLLSDLASAVLMLLTEFPEDAQLREAYNSLSASLETWESETD